MLNWLFGKSEKKSKKKVPSRPWEFLPRKSWPRWVKQAMTYTKLRGAWEGDYMVILTGHRFQYRVTSHLVGHGQWEIGRVERRRGVRKRNK